MQARKLGSAWEVLAPAKLNLYLEILGRRADGFHELETLMVPVRLYDRLAWTPDRGSDDPHRRLVCHQYGRFPVDAPKDDSNLVVRAANVLAAAAGVAPRGQFHLWKRIPAQAGLGGGSSDAAATLVAANAAWGIGYSRRRLQQLAAELGSDVPFFFEKGFAIGRGRGELLTSTGGMPRLHTVIVKPPAGVPTAEAYKTLDMGAVTRQAQRESQRRLSRLVARLRGEGSLFRRGGGPFNRLQHAAHQLCPWIEKLQRVFTTFHCPAHAMTGSGSAYYGLFPSARRAIRFARTLSAMQLGTVYAASSCR